jgi:hypothetical protein
MKPLKGERLNLNHPYARDLVFCSLMNEYTGQGIWDHVSEQRYAFDGTYTPDWGYAGTDRKGVEFNDDREHINGPVCNSILPAGSNGTIIFKFKKTNVPSSGYYYFFVVGDDTSVFMAYYSVTAGGLRIVVDGSPAEITIAEAIFFNGSVFAITWEDNGNINFKLYIDGIYIGEDDTSSSVDFPNSTALINIGGRTDSDDRYAGGIFEWLYIYDKAKSADEIFNITNNPYAMFEEDDMFQFMYVETVGGISIPVVMHHLRNLT